MCVGVRELQRKFPFPPSFCSSETTLPVCAEHHFRKTRSFNIYRVFLYTSCVQIYVSIQVRRISPNMIWTPISCTHAPRGNFCFEAAWESTFPETKHQANSILTTLFGTNPCRKETRNVIWCHLISGQTQSACMQLCPQEHVKILQSTCVKC